MSSLSIVAKYVQEVQGSGAIILRCRGEGILLCPDEPGGQLDTAVAAELEVLSEVLPDTPVRGVGDVAETFADWMASGIIGTAAWTMLAAAGSYIRKLAGLKAPIVDDLAALHRLLESRLPIALGADYAQISITEARRLPSGDWYAELAVGSRRARVLLTVNGKIIRWQFLPNSGQ